MTRNTKKPEDNSNIYKRLRMRAAEKNGELSTLEKASAVLRINREKLGQIEQEDRSRRQCYPDADDVACMIRWYDAPELRNYYCTNVCPLGFDMPKLGYENLNDISLRLILAVQQIVLTQEKLQEILIDGRVTEAEREEFLRILKQLKIVSVQTEALELWAKKNGIE